MNVGRNCPLPSQKAAIDVIEGRVGERAAHSVEGLEHDVRQVMHTTPQQSTVLSRVRSLCREGPPQNGGPQLGHAIEHDCAVLLQRCVAPFGGGSCDLFWSITMEEWILWMSTCVAAATPLQRLGRALQIGLLLDWHSNKPVCCCSHTRIRLADQAVSKLRR